LIRYLYESHDYVLLAIIIFSITFSLLFALLTIFWVLGFSTILQFVPLISLFSSLLFSLCFCLVIRYPNDVAIISVFALLQSLQQINYPIDYLFSILFPKAQVMIIIPITKPLRFRNQNAYDNISAFA